MKFCCPLLFDGGYALSFRDSFEGRRWLWLRSGQSGALRGAEDGYMRLQFDRAAAGSMYGLLVLARVEQIHGRGRRLCQES